MAFTIKKFKVLLCILNIIFAIFGLTCFIWGLASKIDVSDPSLRDGVANGNIAVATVGFVVAIVGVMGFWTAMKEMTSLLRIYGIMQLTLSVIDLFLWIALLLILIKATGVKLESMKTRFDHYNVSEGGIDAIQRGFHCCGYDGPEYWKGNATLSCCIDVATCDPFNSTTLYQIGCSEFLVDAIHSVSTIWVIFLPILAIYQGVAGILGYFLSHMLISDGSKSLTIN